MIKFINFLSTPSYYHHNRISRWYIISCTTIVMLLASLATVSVQQIRTWKHLEQTYKQQLPLQKKTTDLTQQHAKLSKEKSALLEKSESWEKYTHHAKKPSDMFNAIQKSTKENNACHCLRTTRQSIHMQIRVANAQEGTIITQNLSATQIFNEVTLCSFKPNEEGESEVTIKGSMKKA